MKGCLALLLVGSLVATQTAAAQNPAPVASPTEVFPPPTLVLARRSADGNSLQYERPLETHQEYAYTVQVPVTETVEENGVVRQIVKYRPETRTATRKVLVSTPVAVDLSEVEIRTASGGKYKPEDVARVLGDAPMPAILVERYQEMVDGKPTVKVRKFDTTFLRMMKPETPIILLPPVKGVAGPAPGPVAPVSTVPAPAAPRAPFPTEPASPVAPMPNER